MVENLNEYRKTLKDFEEKVQKWMKSQQPKKQ
jgi:hypothetical protein